VDGNPIRVADIPHKPFQKSLKKSTAFKGFVDLTTALELNILTSTKRDTLALQGQTKSDFPPSRASKKSGDIFKLKQTIFCPLYSLGNGSILANDHVGSYILKAIHGPKVNQEFKIYQNDSLTSLVSRAELMERIIEQPASEYPRWDPDANYTTDDVIIYDGKKYQCLVDNIGAKVPPDSPDLWDLIGTQNSELQPTDFNAIKLHYWCQFDKKGQIILKALHAVTIYAYIDFMGIYKPIMAVPAETFRAILLDGGSGTQGLRIWNAVQQGKLGGYVGESSPIIQSK
jgi:hypothetical protein